MRIAVIGSGISGIGSAWLLSREHTVDVYEASDRLGGHAHTVDVAVGGVEAPADTGFMVFNDRTYPNLIAFFDELGIASREADMSFSVQVAAEDIEWSGSSLATVFAQPHNIVNPRFLKMLVEIVRFSRDADRLIADPSVDDLTLGELLEREGYHEGFTDWYLIPMGASIWSTPTAEMLAYPAKTFLRFCDNHGLLHITGKPLWRSVIGGSRRYIEAASRGFSGEVHLSEPVEAVRRTADGVEVRTGMRVESYDRVVFATHAPDTLRILGEDATERERAILSAFSYQPNDVVVHSDVSFLPTRVAAHAGWNWYTDSGEMSKRAISLSYYLNLLQELGTDVPLIETLNAHKEPDPASVHLRLTFDHPLFGAAAIEAQSELPAIQGTGGVWFAGAWTRYGFHEDGLLSAVRVAEGLGVRAPWAPTAESD